MTDGAGGGEIRRRDDRLWRGRRNETWRPRGYCYEALLRFPTLNVASDIREVRADAERRVHGASECVPLKSHVGPVAARDRRDPGAAEEHGAAHSQHAYTTQI